MAAKLRVIHYGVGSIGGEVARLAAARHDMQIVAAVDADPAKAGRDLGAVTGLGRALGVTVTSDPPIALATEADVVVHATGSFLTAVQPQLLQIVDAGKNVVSSCEELAYPWRHNPGLAEILDQRAKAMGVSVLGTGVNPGFVMDTLALVMALACQEIRSIRITRVVDAGARRLPLQRKIGAGMTVEQFRRQAAAVGMGHVGLRESAAMLADTLGWPADDVAETLEPVVAARRQPTAYLMVEPGQVAGIQQQVVYRFAGREVLRLELEMSVGASEPRDEVVIDAVPPIHLVLRGGLHGDRATAAIMLHCARKVIAAPPGLLTMRDLPLAPTTPVARGGRE